MEMQARYCSFMIAEKIKYPSKDEFDAILTKEEKNKACNKRLTFTWNFVSYCDSLALEMGCFPDFNKLKEEDNISMF
jgi:hypothetical protein